MRKNESLIAIIENILTINTDQELINSIIDEIKLLDYNVIIKDNTCSINNSEYKCFFETDNQISAIVNAISNWVIYYKNL
jgi:hypothetical protein